MATRRNDEGGFRRGLGAYSDAKCSWLTEKADYCDSGPGSHEVKYVMDSIGVNVADEGLLDSSKYNDNQWTSGALPRGGKSRHTPTGDSGTSPKIQRVKPSGKYRNASGGGKGFGE